MSEPDSIGTGGMGSLSRNHFRRLRQYYRSAGWPCHDNLEIDLLQLGLVRREMATRGPCGLEAIVVTDAGIGMLSKYLESNRSAHAEHEWLVARVVRHLLAQRRLVFRGLGMRARLEETWALSRPDVFSVRHVTANARLHPAVHEIKVTRADLLGDLKNESKRRAYQSYSQSFYYVIAAGIAESAEIPHDCGLMVASPDRLTLVRPAPHRPATLTTAHWIALARARAEFAEEDERQLRF
jgi:hypothetical protein